MGDTFLPLTIPPGVVRLGTVYASKGRWYDSSLVRFVNGIVRPIGGWSLVRTSAGGDIQATGKPRGSHTWRKTDSTTWAATGTQTKLYAYSNGILTDITPAGLVAGRTDGQLLTGTGGWGSGWGTSPWGGSAAAGTIQEADSWQLDNFGEILIACLTSDGKIYESTPTTQATPVTNSPTGCRAVVVTPERFIFALGAASDPRNVAWCSQGNRTVWTPAVGNSAGSFPLQTSGRLMAGRAGKGETLLWTDSDLWAAQFIGGPLVYSFQQRGDGCGLMGPNAVALVEGTAFWMGRGQFWQYNGSVRPIRCDVLDYVLATLDPNQKAKVHTVTSAQFGEVTWYYPSATQSGHENDRYVTYNYRDGFWTIGQLARAAGNDADVFAQPLLWSTDGHLYSHETGQDRGGAESYIESGPLELGNGDRTMLVNTLLPDEKVIGQVVATFYGSFTSDGAEFASQAYTLSSRTDVRVSARYLRVRFAEPATVGAIYDGTYLHDGTITYGGTGPGADYRVGPARLGVVEGGRR